MNIIFFSFTKPLQKHESKYFECCLTRLKRLNAPILQRFTDMNTHHFICALYLKSLETCRMRSTGCRKQENKTRKKTQREQREKGMRSDKKETTYSFEFGINRAVVKQTHTVCVVWKMPCSRLGLCVASVTDQMHWTNNSLLSSDVWLNEISVCRGKSVLTCHLICCWLIKSHLSQNMV